VKILGIMGSPRIKGNTDLLLDEALKGAQAEEVQVEKITICDLKIAPCKECYSCAKEGKCIQQDDMQDIYASLLDSDGIILASPIFFYGLTSQLKALIDRSQAIWVRKYLLQQKLSDKKRIGAFIGVGATKGKQLFDGSILTAKYFFDAIDVKYEGEVLVRGIDKKDEIRDHPTALSEAFTMGQSLARQLKV
jgi:multimeric flavodoxin WrbA